MKNMKRGDEDVPMGTWVLVFLFLTNLVFMECVYLQIRETKKLLKQDLDACGFTTNAIPDGLECREWAKPDPKP